MIDNIAILITGNPVSSSGVRSIGGIGTGLTVIDPKWPSMAQGNLALIITDKGQSSNYCLMFPSRLISSSGANREGVLNIQLQLPHGKMLADAEGKMVSPFTLMEEVFNHYKQHHLTQYPGVEGWNFANDWEMTQAEFDSLLAPYTLIDRVLPTRHLSGTGEAFIAMSPEKMSQFTLDYAYPELVDYGKVILSTVGSTNPPELTRLEIPRRPRFEIYVNGKKQDGLVREGDEAFSMKIEPPYTYQKPAAITVDFEKAVAEGKVDRVNERINYTVKFEDKEQNWKIKIILKGLEGESNRDKVMNELLKAVYLENRAAEGYQPAEKIWPNGRLSNPLEFTLKGKQIEDTWELKWDKLPENVYKDEVKSLDNGFEVTFSYKKPQSNNGRKRDEQNRADELKPTVQKKEVKVIPVYITARDPKDVDLAKGIEFDMTFILDEENDINLLTYYGIRCDSKEPTEFNRGNKKYPCYEGKVEVPATLWNNWSKYAKTDDVKVESCNHRYKLEAKLYKDKKDGDSSYIAVYASRTSKGAMFLHKWGFWLNILLVLLVLGGCAVIGAYVENNRDLLPNSKAVVAPNMPQEVPDPEVSIGEDGHVYINKKIEVTIGENGHWFINGNDMGRTPNNGIAGEKTLIGNAGRDADDPAPTGSDNVNYAALNAKSARYMELISKAEMSFPQVDEIKKWIDDNRQHGSKIDNYGKIAVAVKDFGKCRDVLMKINAGADIDALCPQIKNVVSTISKDNLLRELRIKMQRFLYEGGKPLKKDEQIIDKIYQFSVKHPDGIRSFKELEDLKEIRVLK